MAEQNFPHTNKFRLLFSIGASILFIFLGINLIEKSERYDQPLLIMGLGIVTVIFFGGLLIFGIRKLLRKK